MASLFVAVDLPAALTGALVALQPPESRWVRLTRSDQMHLTLHYIGAGETERFAAALAEVRAPAFSLAVEGVGQFPSADGAVTLWAGLRQSADLLQLHALVGTALFREGLRPESRLYIPHITLARCDALLAAEEVKGFLARHANFALPPFDVTLFSLYSSMIEAGVPTYRPERTFPMVGSG
jgi:RNA 2',3'-cyclic 3'-phosphodiesterase